MSIYWDKLAHVQVVINYPHSVAHLCTSEATLAHNLGALLFDDVMSYNSLTTDILFWAPFESRNIQHPKTGFVRYLEG